MCRVLGRGRLYKVHCFTGLMMCRIPLVLYGNNNTAVRAEGLVA